MPVHLKWAATFYFPLSFLAAGPLAANLSAAYVEWQKVSAFEGKAGMVATMMTPPVFAVLVALFWFAYLVLRRSSLALWLVNGIFAVFALQMIQFLLELL